MNVFIIIIGIVLGYICYISNFKNKSKKIINKASDSKIVKKMNINYNTNINELKNRGLLIGIIEHLSFSKMFIVLFIAFSLLVIVLYKIIGVLSTAVILSLPIFILPKIIFTFIIDLDKQKTMAVLPGYIINLKNHIEQDNNIIFAINDTICPEPLGKHIKVFNDTVRRGMNVKLAFKKLKKSVNIKLFSRFITAIETCYLNGGDFVKIIERFVDMISKENMHREKFKEKAYSSVIILIVLIVINIYLIFSFVFSNPEYSQIVKETMIGRLILNINALTYIFIGYIISKIYRIGEQL